VCYVAILFIILFILFLIEPRLVFAYVLLYDCCHIFFRNREIVSSLPLFLHYFLSSFSIFSTHVFLSVDCTCVFKHVKAILQIFYSHELFTQKRSSAHHWITTFFLKYIVIHNLAKINLHY